MTAITETFTTTKRCEYCQTAIEFATPGGERFEFRPHDAAFCAIATRERVRILELALVQQREAYERAIERWTTDVDKVLATHGLPSLANQNQASRVEALALLQQIGVLPRVSVLPRLCECPPDGTRRWDGAGHCHACGRRSHEGAPTCSAVWWGANYPHANKPCVLPAGHRGPHRHEGGQ